MTHPWQRRGPARQLAASLALWIALVPTAATAEERGSMAGEGSAGLGAAVATLVYAPLKLVYATGGLVISSLAWLWTRGDSDVAGQIARVSMEGDYVVTPSHVTRRSELVWDGR